MIAAVMSSCDSFMVDGSALFVENVYRPFKSDEEDHHYLNVGRVVGVLMVVGGILITEYFHSVISLWRFLVPLPAFWGIAVWAGILWRRANGYGAWGGILGSAAIWVIVNDVYGLELQDQVVWYLIGGVSALIIATKLSPALPKERLDKFYAFLHTPVGDEQKLIDAGYEIRH